MMNLKIHIFSVLMLVMSGAGLNAQDNTSGMINPAGRNPAVTSPQKGILLKPGWNVNLGSSMMYSQQFGTVSAISVTPVFTLPLSQRLYLHGGASLTRFAGPLAPFMQETGRIPSGGIVTMFSSASYKVNDHILLYGEGVKHLGKLPLNMPFSPYMSDNFTIGSMFKLGDHLTIGASLRMDGNSYSDFNPYNPFDRYTIGPSPFTPWP
ncbi:MAG TPA: hypothetical protein VE870_07385 [Bacteroidales bacterium]|nr:hypothetical protein [Bacteroidales bacterium]